MSFHRILRAVGASLTLGLACAMTHAAVSEQELAQLGTTLTPWGAEIAGTPDGRYPAYTGGINAPPAWAKNSRYCSPKLAWPRTYSALFGSSAAAR